MAVRCRLGQTLHSTLLLRLHRAMLVMLQSTGRGRELLMRLSWQTPLSEKPVEPSQVPGWHCIRSVPQKQKEC